MAASFASYTPVKQREGNAPVPAEIRSARNDDAIRRGSAAGKWSHGVGPILLAASPWPATDASACRCSIAGRNAEHDADAARPAGTPTRFPAPEGAQASSVRA